MVKNKEEKIEEIVIPPVKTEKEELEAVYKFLKDRQIDNIGKLEVMLSRLQ